MAVDFTKKYHDICQRRLDSSSKKLNSMIDTVDPANLDPDTVETIARWQKEISNDSKSYWDGIIETQKLELEKQKIEADKFKTYTESQDRKKGRILEWFKGIGAIGVAVGSIWAGIWKFDRSTQKENDFDEPYLTLTQKATVQDGLRDTAGKFLNIFK